MLEAQRRPLRERRADVQQQRRGREARRPAESARGAPGRGARNARELALQQVGGRRERGSVSIPAPRRAARERRTALARPFGDLRIGARECHVDARWRGAGAGRRAQRQREFRRHGSRRGRHADGEGAAVGLAHEAAFAGRRVPTPRARRRNGRERRLRDDARELAGQRRDQRALRDRDVDAAVAPARRRDEMRLVRRPRELVLERERRRRGDAVGRHRRQRYRGQAHQRGREDGFPPIGRWPRRGRAAAGLHAVVLRVEERPRVVARGRRRGGEHNAQNGHVGFKMRRARAR